MGASDDLQRMRVADLRDELARRSLDTGGLKAALVSRLAKALRSEKETSSSRREAEPQIRERDRGETDRGGVDRTTTSSVPDSAYEDPDEETFRIIVATDNHLGYKEDDQIRKDDSFDAFDECFRIARERKADLVLLGGDIFHQNKPSKRTICKTIEILRRHCLDQGKRVGFKVLNGKEDNVFSTKFGSTNYEDPNFHVGLPTFTIHGNHDDPAGVDQVSPLDILSSSNLLNYYGKSGIEGEGMGSVTIKPVLLGKGDTKVALYGLGWIKDERLAKLFSTPDGVKWFTPDGPDDEYFNIFTIHQNRVHHSPKMCIKESLFWQGLDLVIWGHEHESIPHTVQAEKSEYVISQLGSTVQTSLTEGEAKQKHCMMLEIRGSQWRTTPIPLRTVRPFVFDNLNLSQELPTGNSFGDDGFGDGEGGAGVEDRSKEIEDLIHKKVEDMLNLLAQDQDPSLKEKLPLVRLRVNYTGFTTINTQRFGQKFVGRVANPNDIVVFIKKQGGTAGEEGAGGKGLNQSTSRGNFIPDAQEQDCIDRFIADNLTADLEVLKVKELNQALHEFVEKDEAKAFHACIDKAVDRATSREANGKTAKQHNDLVEDLLGALEDDDDVAGAEATAGKKKGKGKGKGRAGPSGGKKKPTALDSDKDFAPSDEDDGLDDWTQRKRSQPATSSRAKGKRQKTIQDYAQESQQGGTGRPAKRSLPLSFSQRAKPAKAAPRASGRKKRAAAAEREEEAVCLDSGGSQDSLDFMTPAGTEEASKKITRGGNFFQRSRGRQTQGGTQGTRALPKSWGKAL